MLETSAEIPNSNIQAPANHQAPNSKKQQAKKDMKKNPDEAADLIFLP